MCSIRGYIDAVGRLFTIIYFGFSFGKVARRGPLVVEASDHVQVVGGFAASNDFIIFSCSLKA